METKKSQHVIRKSCYGVVGVAHFCNHSAVTVFLSDGAAGSSIEELRDILGIRGVMYRTISFVIHLQDSSIAVG